MYITNVIFVLNFFCPGLKIHIFTVHEGHKDYQSNYCGKSFTDAPATSVGMTKNMYVQVLAILLVEMPTLVHVPKMYRGWQCWYCWQVLANLPTANYNRLLAQIIHMYYITYM